MQNMDKLTAIIITAVFVMTTTFSLQAKKQSEEPVKATKNLSIYITRPGAVIQMDKAMFEEKVYNEKTSPETWKYIGDKPCIIDFYTTWCGPCKRLSPILEQLAEQYDDMIVVYRVDAEKEKELSRKIGIKAYPSLLFCPMNNQPQMAVGLRSKAELNRLIQDLLLK